MSRVYVIEDGVKTANEFERLHCTDEDKELQNLLATNSDLLPSDQIDPDNPPKWLLVKREMPVPEPSSGENRWSIDFLYVDQFGLPTFVECKRYKDSRSRREVIGQMFEYVANGHYYWTADHLREHAEQAAGGEEALKKQLETLRGDCEMGVEKFFALVQQNLREAKVRLIFFMEESPAELRSIVDFLNRSLSTIDVLIIEARQYKKGDLRIVIPTLFGYTEQARAVKFTSRKEIIQNAGDLGQESFYAALGRTVPDEKQAIASFIKEIGAEWVNPLFRKNCIFVLSGLPKRGLFAINRDGKLECYFRYWHPSYGVPITEDQRKLVERFQAGLEAIFQIDLTDKDKRGFPSFSATKWLDHRAKLKSLIHGMATAAEVVKEAV